jgi:tetratricopeptide (TPR) repeat protein
MGEAASGMAEPTIEQLLESGTRHHREGRLAEAERIYRRILERQRNHDGALHLLGVIARETGHTDMAIKLIRRAIGINPRVAGYYNNLGNALCGKEQFGEAAVAYRQALGIDPDFALAHYNLGNALVENDEFDGLDEAIAAGRRTILLQPDYAEAYNNLSIALQRKGNFDESISLCRRALALKPDYAEAYSNLGNALRDKGDLDASIAAYRRAIELKPDFAAAHFNLAMVLLLGGDFRQGWAEYEWRLKDPRKPQPRPFIQPRWTGEDISGRTILLYGEQGTGDALQFVRYAPLVAQRGGRVLIGCAPELTRVLRSNPGLGQILTRDGARPSFDFHAPLLSLPLIFQTDAGSIPASVPYLSAEPALLDVWDRRLGAPDGQVRVGLVWAGNPRFKGDRTRSLNLQQLAPFADAREVKFYSLQKGPAGVQAKNPPAGLELVELGPELNDFADTAAVMSLMDLIITTDTSVPHLAGALGRAVWVMLQFVPDFRWLLERDDSPWYPTMRLFRQTSVGDWKGVIQRVVEALAKFRNEGTPR